MRRVVPLLVSILLGLLILTGAAAAQPSDFEPNDSPEEATEGVAGNYTAVSIDAAESDYYSIQLDEGDTLTVAIEHDHATANLDISVRAPNGERVASSDSTTDNESVSITADEGGKYDVRVYNNDETAAEYDLSIQRKDAVAIVTYDPQSGDTSRRFVEWSDAEFDFDASSLPEDTSEARYTEPETKQRIRNTGDYPWSAVGHLNGVLYCTATLIEDNHAITAAHCVYNDTSGTWAGENGSSVQFYPGRDGVNANITVNVTRVQTYAEYVQTDNRTYDAAVLTLNRSLSDEIGTFGFEHYDPGSGAYDASLFGDSDTRLTGYPSARANYVTEAFSQWDIAVQGEGTSYIPYLESKDATDCFGTNMCHIFDTGGPAVGLSEEITIDGYSGGPVWHSTENNRPEILSIMSGGPTGETPDPFPDTDLFQESVGIRITEEKYSDIGQMIQDGSDSSAGSSNVTIQTADEEVEIGERVQFEATPRAVPETVDVVRYVWDFGHDVDVADTTASHTYVRSGSYNVSVTAVTGSGTRYNGTTELTVEPTFAEVEPLGDGVRTRNNSVYRLELSEGQSLGLSSYGGRGGRGSEVLIYGPDGELVQAEYISDQGLFFGTTAEQSGPHYVGINTSGGITQDISTSVAPVVHNPDRFEPNQNRSAVAPVETDTTATKLTLTESDTSDWYAVTVNGPAEINVSAEVSIYGRFQGGVGLQIYNSDNTSIGTVDSELPAPGSEDPKSYNESAIASGAYNEPEQRAEVSEPGTYYVRVRPSKLDALRRPDGVIEYNLSLDVSTSASDDGGETTGNDANEPNDDFEDATAIEPGSYDDLQIVDGESDFFAVDMRDNQSLDVSIDFIHSNGDFDLAVFGPN